MNKFTIRYPNGIKRHVKRLEIELLGASLTQIGPHEYRANSLQHDFEEANAPRFLAGQFIIEEPDGRKHGERLQTPAGLIAGLIKRGFQPHPLEMEAA